MGGAPELPIGLATLPATQPVRSPLRAIEATFSGRSVPTVPVPAGHGAGLLAQAIQAFEGVRELTPGRLGIDPSSFGVRPVEAVTIDDASFDTMRLALAGWPASETAATASALRVDMLGPVSLALELMGAGVQRTQAVEAARVSTVYRSEALLGACRAVESTLPVMVVMIEPRLVGSAHPTFAFTSREVRSLLDPVVDALDITAGTSDLVIGIHVPGRADLRTIISSGVSMLSIPLDPTMIGWAPWIQALLDNGGHLAWGAVPVDRPLGTHAELLWRHLAATWADLGRVGVDHELLVRRSLVTTSNDLAGFGAEQLRGVIALVDGLARQIAEHADRALIPILA